MSNQFTIITDSREQLPLQFPGYDISIAKLDTGDYTIQGYENILCIERKGSLAEIYKNFTEKRFWAELVRMAPFKHKFLVIECTFNDIAAIPYSLGLPKSAWSQLKLTPQYITKCVGDIQIKYGVDVIFAGDRDTASDIIINIMKRVTEHESRP